jgi:acetolactate synthase-1/3 small subunit
LAGLVARRGYNVSSLSVGKTDCKGFSRFTLVVEGDDEAVGQIVKQLEKLVETVEVKKLSNSPFVERWMTLVKVKAPLEIRPLVLQTAEVFRSRVVDVGEEALVFESTGDRGKVQAFLEAVRPFGVLEVASSGAVAMGRGGFAESHPDHGHKVPEYITTHGRK